jgi:hypothetical protein
LHQFFQQVTATLSGLADIPTRFYLFMDGETSVMVDVPAFSLWLWLGPLMGSSPN